MSIARRTLPLLTVALAACSSGSDSADAPRPNVVVYVIDTLRADRLGAYGYDADTSPVFDALADEATLFERAVAQAPWTLPSVASLVTSSYVPTHQVYEMGRVLADDVELMSEYMQRLGYHTVGFNHNAMGGSVIGADAGYDEYYERGTKPRTTAPDAKPPRSLAQWIHERETDEPFFAYVQTVEPHIPYEPQAKDLRTPVEPETIARINELTKQFSKLTHGSFGTPEEPGPSAAKMTAVRAELESLLEPLSALYDAEIRRADRNLGTLVETLKRKGLWEDTVLVVTSDHGEELLDHGYFLHDQSLHAELVHVPLLLRVPGRGTGLRVSDPVQAIDVLPTLAALLDAPHLPGWQGRSLVPLARRRAAERRAGRDPTG